MQTQNPLYYQEVTFLNSISLMIIYCFPESAPKLFKRNSLSPDALRLACTHLIPEVHLISFLTSGGKLTTKDVVFVCSKGLLLFLCEEEINLLPKLKL